ncbi:MULTISPECIES: SCO1860 family LAETG-anchored protein [Streptomyces]|uniref:LPXTG cell wall anchor domain-containing protein n=2 Tax=Streptomyces lycii TaxID=2654337 RepID=A0ABQ7FMZ6_9ACTN|nr:MULTISPECIES: SCO1860 family LAETG-anchored protein [Streptomyces]KAF4410289.1 LPXTG cell wall anchor domain-containing protein [Streptomyces lycii]PGH51035.1 hypothetical protein CRI70_08960 [Streptomyces sp. Ru87]
MPVRRPAAALTAAALVAGTAVLYGAGPAQAAEGDGKAGAVVLRTGLDVSLLDKTAEVPLAVTLNEVHAPADAEKSALTARLDGVDNGKPFNVLRADVATSRATADDRKAEGYANLLNAKVHVPGLPLLSLVEIEKVTSRAVCEAGKKPTATSELPGSITVLGKKTTIAAAGSTKVQVPGVGEVSLDLAKTSTTSRTAAATALELNVSVDPLELNVAEVKGQVKLAEATCETPAGTTGEPAEPAPSAPAGQDGSDDAEDTGVGTQTGSGKESQDLAETGGSSATPYLAAGAAALVVAGGAAVAVARRRSTGSQG